jgi:hypothetical protein
MQQRTQPPALDRLRDLVGAWRAEIPYQGRVYRLQATFEWLPGQAFLIQRWEAESPFPSGSAIIGPAQDGEGCIQHYFDERGVEREYQMDLKDGVWTLQRMASTPDFSQRFVGTLSANGSVIVGRWERSDNGSTWALDFELTYRRQS